MKWEQVHITVDYSVVCGDDPWPVIEPIWWQVDINDTPEDYELSLLQFSLPQRLMFAFQWYRSEVNNGGHQQFYYNATGRVWPDVLKALEAIDAPNMRGLFLRSLEMLRDEPPLDRDDRCELLDKLKPDFSKLDEQFPRIEEDEGIDELVMQYIQNYPKDFYFDGFVRRAVFPW